MVEKAGGEQFGVGGVIHSSTQEPAQTERPCQESCVATFKGRKCTRGGRKGAFPCLPRFFWGGGWTESTISEGVGGRSAGGKEKNGALCTAVAVVPLWDRPIGQQKLRVYGKNQTEKSRRARLVIWSIPPKADTLSERAGGAGKE